MEACGLHGGFPFWTVPSIANFNSKPDTKVNQSPRRITQCRFGKSQSENAHKYANASAPSHHQPSVIKKNLDPLSKVCNRTSISLTNF
jgi:hypothetical protein